MTSDQIVGDMDSNEVVKTDSKVIVAGMQAGPDKSPSSPEQWAPVWKICLLIVMTGRVQLFIAD